MAVGLSDVRAPLVDPDLVPVTPFAPASHLGKGERRVNFAVRDAGPRYVAHCLIADVDQLCCGAELGLLSGRTNVLHAADGGLARLKNRAFGNSLAQDVPVL